MDVLQTPLLMCACPKALLDYSILQVGYASTGKWVSIVKLIMSPEILTIIMSVVKSHKFIKIKNLAIHISITVA